MREVSFNDTPRQALLSHFILLFGILNAILYCSLLPLWEGFDEAFHYGYVQHLSTRQSLLVLDQTSVSEEVWQALQAQPVSQYIQESAQAPFSFKQYFGLSNEQRSALRRQLESIPPADKYQPHSGLLNYEAYQAPLPYLFLALPDRLMSGWPITRRVFGLRLLLSLTSVILIYTGIALLARELAVPHECATAAAFCVYCSQMLYGVVAHVCNDSLAVPAMLFFIWSAVRFVRAPSKASCSILAVTLSLGLLIKAHFLAMAPLAFLLLGWQLWRRRAPLGLAGVFLGFLCILVGPSYVRNIAIYQSIDGTTQLARGLGFQQAFDAFVHIPWGRSILYMATSSIWTGNNSFTTFSAKTLYLVLFLLATSMALYFVHRKYVRRIELVVLGAIGSFCAALFYVTLASYHATKGRAIAAVPWYAQVLLPPILLMSFLAMSRAGSIGRWLAMVTLVMWSYLICATYVLKLIPQYGGFTEPRAHLGAIYWWYMHEGSARNAILTPLLLTPPWWIYTFTCITVTVCVSVCARSAWNILSLSDRASGS